MSLPLRGLLRRGDGSVTDWSVPTPASWDVVLEAEKLREPKNGKKAVEKVFSVD